MRLFLHVLPVALCISAFNSSGQAVKKPVPSTKTNSNTQPPPATVTPLASQSPATPVATPPGVQSPKPPASPSIACASPAPTDPTSGVNPSETAAYTDLLSLTGHIATAPCVKATTDACKATQTDLNNLLADARAATIIETACSVIGKKSDGTALPTSDTDWYKARAALWAQIATENAAHGDNFTNGTYVLPQGLANALLVPYNDQLAAAPAPAPTPFDCTKTSDVPLPDIAATEALIQKWPDSSCTANPPIPATCLSAGQNLSAKVAALTQNLQYCANNGSTTGNYNRDWYVKEADNWQALNLDMQTKGSSLEDGSYVIPSAWLTPSHTTPPRYSGSPYVRAMLGGTFSGASGIDPESKLLADVFADIPLKSITWTSNDHQTHYRKVLPWVWGDVRIGSIGTAQSAVDPSQIVAAYAALSNSKPGAVVQSFEMNAGLGLQIASITSHVDMFDRLTLSVIAGGGALTPLSPSQSQPEDFMVNAEVEAAYKGADYTPCTNNTTPPTTPASPYDCYLQIYTQDRSRFYRDYELGFRIKAYPSIDPNHVLGFPAMFDVTFGENEYVTGGEFKGAVLHLGGSAPLLASGLYAFGSMDVGIHNKADQPGPLLIPVATPATGIPVVSDAIAPYNRDRWTIGVGVDVLQLIRSHLLQDSLSHK